MRKIGMYGSGPKKEMAFSFPKGATIVGVEAITKDRIGIFYLFDPFFKEKELRTFIMEPVGANLQNTALLSPPKVVYIPAKSEYQLFFEKLPDPSQAGWLEKPFL